MKHTTLVGIAVLCTPLAGCGLNPFGSMLDKEPQIQALAPTKQPAPAPEANVVPTDIESAIKVAQDARKNGEFAAAIKVLSQVMLLAPDNPRVLGEYGKTLAAQGRSDDALAFLERATQLAPGDWTLFSAQGVAYDQKGIYRAAQTSYARALSLNPGEPTVLNNNALSHLQSGDLDGAEQLLRSAGPAGQSDPRIAKNLALVQSLRTEQAEKKIPVAAPPSAPSPVPAPPVAQNPTPSAPPQDIVAAAQPASPPPPVTEHAAPPLSPAPAVEAVALASPPTVAPKENRPQEPAPIEALKADPTVVMQPLPAERSAPLPPPAKPEPVRAVTKKAAAAEHTPADALAVRTAAGKAFFVQAGAFGTEARAGKAASGLESLGARVTPGNSSDGHALYRVRIGPFLNRQQASEAIGQAQALGHADVIIVSE